ncbi:hypothetical protein Srubr_68220 [Streptomyces rubradiris]|uniref:Secreted protein n=1 Tax=Streptomyces rubradiris TaxID=285531 RepID=A0ABQ3RM92_STRRR|nr:hypothetical protein GCM10018792_20860 [Streptomyces rubradiris]GHI56976.1 hypothetical protein Srubr_68220 [Streptomyces rubradiris]
MGRDAALGWVMTALYVAPRRGVTAATARAEPPPADRVGGVGLVVRAGTRGGPRQLCAARTPVAKDVSHTGRA